MRLIHLLEPLLWLLFGAGGMLAALLLPGLIFGFGIAAPHHLFSDYATSYHRLHGIAASPAGRVILVALISLVSWHAAHHLRHFALDMGLKRLEAPVCYALYGLALLTTLGSIAAVAAL